MDHDYINEHSVVALYVTGKLSPEERSGFEEHFVDCQQCLDQIKLTDDLRRALKGVAKEDAARSYNAREAAGAPWAGIAVWQQPRIVAYASLVLAFALTGALVAGVRYHRSELADARRTSDDWQRRYADERRARETLQEQVEQSGKTPSQSPDQTQLAANLPPAPLFFLNVTRGGEQGEPANRIAVPPASPWIALSLEFEKDPAFRSYRARLNDAQGRTLWSAENIPSPPAGAIAITLPSHLLSKGDYSVVVEGLTATGRYLPAAHFAFQANPTK
ncbi:MAG TPA: hypothetical protein VKR60_05100 [Candidatus Sulfotelmatobacter sp.]|nr:hypothetical protein [Candidatus Sulfotelmatobacter sp.]